MCETTNDAKNEKKTQIVVLSITTFNYLRIEYDVFSSATHGTAAMLHASADSTAWDTTT